MGKVEAGIPEDDPRNPGVIADNVGDNVGDIAGMGSDIFESYCGSMIACIAIASTMAITTAEQSAMMAFPLALASIGLLASVAGIVIVRARSSAAPEAALRSGTLGAPLIFSSHWPGSCQIAWESRRTFGGPWSPVPWVASPLA